ncbi:MAG: hypothetical protein CMO80_09135 [Verrucomicrobiales bacterium]|nr:hypothetical protein [Verrucomicrobiales bacterium]
MNRTLLLIMCDFLLLNLLALTRWEQVEPPVEQEQAQIEPAEKEEEEDKEENKDMVGLLKAALEKESMARAELEKRLQFTETNFESQQKAMSQLEKTRQGLESDLNKNQAAYQKLTQQYSTLDTAAAKSRQEAERLNTELTERQAEIQMKIRDMAMLEQQKNKALTTSSNLVEQLNLSEAEKKLAEERLKKELEAAKAERERILADKDKLLSEKAMQMAELQKEKDDSEKRVLAMAGEVQNLNTQIKSEKEQKEMLNQNVSELRKQVNIERAEKEKIQYRTERLTAGFEQLAVKSKELTQEFRESIEINPNRMVNDFLSNRVDVTIQAVSRGLFGFSDRTKTASTLLARDITGVYALLHVTDSPFNISRPAIGMEKINTTVNKKSRELAFRPLEFLAADPRIIAVPVSETMATLSGIKIYNLSANPFRFPAAVLIGKGGRYFGEAQFKLDPNNPNFVKVKGGFFKALRGEFSPSSGDLVLSKSGELLGVMVNSDYCVLLRNLQRLPGSQLNETFRISDTKRLLEELKLRLEKLPYGLQ